MSRETLANHNDTASLRLRLRRLRVDSSRQWGRMTAHQMICHLNDSYRAVAGDRTVSPAVTRKVAAIRRRGILGTQRPVIEQKLDSDDAGVAHRFGYDPDGSPHRCPGSRLGDDDRRALSTSGRQGGEGEITGDRLIAERIA
jgi:hypothetical protein